VSPSRRGFSLLELMITLSLSGVALYSIAAIVHASSGFYKVSSSNMDLQGKGSRAIHQIADALRGTALDSIAALPLAPLTDTSLLFQTIGPYSGQATTTFDPAQITLQAGEIVRTDSFLLPEEQRKTLLTGVSDLFEGESFNGLDDNGNGFIDEPGLFFARQGSTIIVGLTLQSGDTSRSWITRVVCRN
jgi:prepilin-type N-terminal cleavage/methylation domain-containing protein